MKIKMLFALWACLALSETVFCAEEESKKDLRDTIVIIPDTNIKVVFIGHDMKAMSTFARIDTVKNMLINDIAKASLREGYPKAAKTTHYFVSSEGKRRLKAETEDYLEQGVDVEKEKRSLMLGLLPYAYYIHDLESGYELQLYIADPAQINSLGSYKLGDAIATI